MADTTDPQTPRPRSTCRWTRVMLFVSLAVNLLIVGLVAGAIYNGGPQRVALPRDGTTVFLRALEPEDRRALLKEMRAAGKGPAKSRQEARQHFQALIAALRAEPFDVDAVRGALDAQKTAADARRGLTQGAFLERLSTMDATQRAAFAQRLEKVAKRPKPRPGDRDARP